MFENQRICLYRCVHASYLPDIDARLATVSKRDVCPYHVSALPYCSTFEDVYIMMKITILHMGPRRPELDKQRSVCSCFYLSFTANDQSRSFVFLSPQSLCTSSPRRAFFALGMKVAWPPFHHLPSEFPRYVSAALPWRRR